MDWRPAGYTEVMNSPLEEVIAGLESQLVDNVERLAEARHARRYVEVLEYEERIERLQSSLVAYAQRLAADDDRPLP